MRKKYSFKHWLGTVGDFTTEWWTDKDWEEHRKYVQELKNKGEYGKEVEITYELEYCPELDDSTVFLTKENHSTAQFIIFDIAK